MNFTREELEDIWNNKPYGYFTELRKKNNLKKLKKYKVEATIHGLICKKELEVRDISPVGREVDKIKSILRQQIIQEYGDTAKISFHTHYID